MAHMSMSVEISNSPKESDQREELPPGIEVFWIAGPVFLVLAKNY